MKTAIYSPYIDTAAGGEMYMLSIAEAFAKKDSVDILLDDRLQIIGEDKIRNNLNAMFPIDWTNINFKNAPVGSKSSAFNKYSFTKQYDYLFYLTDGSMFYSGAKKSYLHIQMPLPLFKSTIVNKLKLSSWKQVIYNSCFTQGYMKNRIGLPSKVIYPPVDIEKIKPAQKKNIITNVGRFVRVKRQDVLIEAFRTIARNKPNFDWELILMGGLSQGDVKYLEELKQMSKGLRVRIIANISRDDLIQNLSESKIYWHAMGYETDDPVKQEHFGISVVEAMAAGCTPVIINKGGLSEIIDKGKYGILWESMEDLIIQTQNLIEKNDFDMDAIIERSHKFSKESFIKEFADLKNK